MTQTVKAIMAAGGNYDTLARWLSTMISQHGHRLQTTPSSNIAAALREADVREDSDPVDMIVATQSQLGYPIDHAVEQLTNRSAKAPVLVIALDDYVPELDGLIRVSNASYNSIEKVVKELMVK